LAKGQISARNGKGRNTYLKQQTIFKLVENCKKKTPANRKQQKLNAFIDIYGIFSLANM